MDERKNLKRLEEETAELAEVQKRLQKDNQHLQEMLNRL